MPKPQISLAYCTNIWTHHQAPICGELASLLSEERFKMCLFEPVHEERKRLGWGSEAAGYRWITGPPRSSREMKRLCQLVCDADVAVLGACPQELRQARVATGKLTFIMSERLFKQPLYWWRFLNPRFALGIRKFKRTVNRDNVHYLAIGAYAGNDVRRIGAFEDRMWTWAYFVDLGIMPPHTPTQLPVNILWAGRMLEWKRVDLLLKAISHLYTEPTFGRLDIIGDGPERPRLLKLSYRLGLKEKCVFHEPKAPERIREFMRQAEIYVLPSNRYEGWGAVANEAMSEGAVLVANEFAGSSRILIDHGRTGFMFRDGDIKGLEAVLRNLLRDPILRQSVRKAAWIEMAQYWNPPVGATRLVALSRGILEMEQMPQYSSGPCAALSA